MASDLLTKMRDEIEVRLGELRPVVSEYERLLAAVDALSDAGVSAANVIALAPRATSSQPGATSESRATVPAQASSAPTRRRRGPRGSAAGALRRAASPARAGDEGKAPSSEVKSPSSEVRAPSSGVKSPKPERAARGAAQQAIVAALEHGSHTVGELVVVTAMSGANIRGSLRRLLKERAITRTKREGKAAYTLSSPPSSG